MMIYKYYKKLISLILGGGKYVFKKKYFNNGWGDIESVSGSGSTIESTKYLLPQIESLVKDLGIEVFLDVPCGDYNWIKYADFGDIKYIGGDIVSELIEINNLKYKNSSIQFLELDVINDAIPNADIIFVRDCFVHMSFRDAKKAISNIQKSNVKYVAITTFIDVKENKNIKTGGWRPLNFELPPFNFPPPDFSLFENCMEDGGKYNDKHIGVWRKQNIIRC